MRESVYHEETELAKRADQTALQDSIPNAIAWMHEWAHIKGPDEGEFPVLVLSIRTFYLDLADLVELKSYDLHVGGHSNHVHRINQYVGVVIS